MTVKFFAVPTGLWEEEQVEQFAKRLDAKVERKFQEIETTDMWKAIASLATPLPILSAIIREVCLEIYSYHPTSTEAIIGMIGRMPKTEPNMIRTMLLHQVDEADRGEMALNNYLALGGDERYARTRRRSPASLVFDGMWWELFRSENPFTYLGAMYPFDSMMPTFWEKVECILVQRGMPANSLGSIVDGAKEDGARSHLIRNVIKEVIRRFPDADKHIEYGMDCFLQVFPIPVWTAAYQRAVRQKPIRYLISKGIHQMEMVHETVT